MVLPTGTRTPIVLVDVDPQLAESGPSIQLFRGLIIGQRTSSGAVPQLELTRLASPDAVGQAFGFGSLIHRTSIPYFAADRITETWFLALDDDGGGVAKTTTVTVGGAPTAAGTLYLYVNGTRLVVNVLTTDTPTTIAAALAAAVTADQNLPFTAGSALGVLTLTAKNAGLQGNALDVRLNFQPGEALPAGVTAVVAAGVAGAGDPTNLPAAIALLGDTQYHVLAVALDDATTIGAIDVELAARFTAERKKHGHAFFGSADTASNLNTKGSGLNSKHVTVLGANDSPTHPVEWAGALAGTASREFQADPARPLQRLALPGLVAPPPASRFTLEEQEALLRDGIATFFVDDQGLVKVSRAITTFQTNDAGAPSVTFLDVTTLFTISFITFDLDTSTVQRFPRSKLANDGTRFGPGQPVLTPNGYRGFVLTKGREWESLGLIENFEQLKRDLQVTRDGLDSGRLNVVLPPDLVNGARVFGVSFQFQLQAAAA